MDPLLILEQRQQGMTGEIFRQMMDLTKPLLRDRLQGCEQSHLLLGTVPGDIHDLCQNASLAPERVLQRENLRCRCQHLGDLIHIGDDSGGEFFFEVIVVETGSADQDLHSPALQRGKLIDSR